MNHQKKLIKLAVSSVLGASLYASNLLSLGLGDIESSTQLNQPLRAKIKLIAAKDFTQDDLSAKIASFEAYGKFGVLREPVHGQLKFQVETHSDGSKYINVTSTQAIKEPFLNFLVELNWPQGRLLREYTVLLDPPSLTPAKQEVIVAPKPVVQTKPTSRPISRPEQTQEVVRQTETKPAINEVRSNQPQVRFEGDTWSVGQGETLWSIAKRLRPEGATVPQTLAALYRNNPNAFINNDIDRLKAGTKLALPSNAMIQSIESSISYNDLKSSNSSSAPLDVRKNVSERAVANDSSSSGRLTISSVDDSELVDETGANLGDGTGEAAVSGSQDELQETVDALRLENEQLKAELVAVKTLDNNGIAVEDETLSVIAGSAEAKDSDDEALQALASENESIIESSKLESNADAGSSKEPVVEASNNQADLAFWQKDGFWKWPLIILASLLSLLGLGFFLKKRKDNSSQEFVASSETNQIFERQQPSFTSKSIPEPEEDESDPLDQADILIARGRLDEVENLLLSVLEKEPENHVARVKLLEVYSSNDDIANFKTQFLAMPDSFDYDSELGLKVNALMQLHQEPENTEVETSVDEQLFLNEEQIFGESSEDINESLTEELDDILQQAAESDAEQASNADKPEDNSIEFSLRESEEASQEELVLEENSESQVSNEEVNTKLELAKAYISMGDDESASEILKEVKKEGNDEQQQLASELLSEI